MLEEEIPSEVRPATSGGPKLAPVRSPNRRPKTAPVNNSKKRVSFTAPSNESLITCSILTSSVDTISHDSTTGLPYPAPAAFEALLTRIQNSVRILCLTFHHYSSKLFNIGFLIWSPVDRQGFIPGSVSE